MARRRAGRLADGCGAALLERQILARLVGATGTRGNDWQKWLKDLKRVYDTEDLAPGKK